MTDHAFERWGNDTPASPVVLSVPHAGRDYPLPLRAALRQPASILATLEDRYLDAVATAAWTGEAMLVQQLGRAWIDLNRDETERDPRVDEGASKSAALNPSAKLRSGLGLVPRRAGVNKELWRRRFNDADISARIADAHRPYHAALTAALAAARARFGTAVLLDLHSMPPLGAGEAQVVLGDRFGRSAGGRFVARAEAAVGRAGIKVALNSPYAGAHILERHGAPGRGIHAIQVELDRRLYLDPRLDQPGSGLERTAALVRRLVAELADEATAGELPIAAE